MTIDLLPIWLSLRTALLSVIVVLPWGIFWGWVLARWRFRGRAVVQTLLYMPLVLPPVLTGYGLLWLLGGRSLLGRFLWGTWGLRFVLDWKGTVIAAAVVAAPFMIEAVRQALTGVDPRLELAARNLGAGRAKVFWTITVPLSWSGLLTGGFLVFARSIGEFGATIMVAGNIEGETQTIPLAIYSRVYMGQDASILPLVIAALIFAYGGLACSQWFNRRGRKAEAWI